MEKDTGLLVWQATVINADEEAGRRDTAITMKFLAKVPAPCTRTYQRDCFAMVPAGVSGGKTVPGVGSEAMDAVRTAAFLLLDPVTKWSGDRGDLAADGTQRSAGTELVYRHDLRPVEEWGAVGMDSVFDGLRTKETTIR